MAVILVVDDEPANRYFLTTLLRYAGHSLLEANDGASALEVIRAERPDLVIADLVMPEMDGFELVRHVRAEPDLAATRIVFYSAAYGETEVESLAAACGVRHVLGKPAEPEVVLQTVNAALSVAPPPAAPAPPEFERDHLRVMTDMLSRKVQELKTMGRRLKSLLEVGKELAMERERDRLLERVAEAAREVAAAGYAAIGLLEEDGATIKSFVARGPGEDFVWPAGAITQTVLAGRRTLRTVLEGQSLLAVPVASAERLYGWLELRDKLGASEFDEDDEEVARMLAAQQAVAYENLLRSEEIGRHTALLEERVAERTAELQRSNADLEQFAYVASHDLQEPLRKVTSFTGLVLERWGDQLDPTAREFMGYAVDGAARMRRLITDVLAYSRVGKSLLGRGPVDLQSVLARALDNLREAIAESGARISHDPLPRVIGDEPQLAQLLQNLLGNAIKFSGGRQPSIHVGAAREGDRWRISVREHGIGVDPQYADRIFGLFQRLHTRDEYPGTGLGLAICSKVVERHGGRLWVESAAGEGATFLFTLEAFEAAAGRQPGALSPMRILVADDDAADARLLCEAIRDSIPQTEVSVVKDGVEALAYLRREAGHASAPRPDVLLLDLNMPRKGGRQVLAEMKADPQLRGIPVVVLTTSEAIEDITEAYALNARCYFAKPDGPSEYTKVVRAIEHFRAVPERVPA